MDKFLNTPTYPDHDKLYKQKLLDELGPVAIPVVAVSSGFFVFILSLILIIFVFIFREKNTQQMTQQFPVFYQPIQPINERKWKMS